MYDYYKNPESINSNKKATLNSLYPKWLEYKELHGASPAYIKRIESDWRNYYKGTEIVTVPIADFKKLQLDMWAHELIQAKGKTKKPSETQVFTDKEVEETLQALEFPTEKKKWK